jgi:hypothetical protein
LKLDAIDQGDEAFLYMERYVDEGARTYSPFAARTEVEARYQPRSDNPSFDLPTVCAPQARVSVCQADPATSLLQHYVRPQGVLFAVHPETWVIPGIEHLAELQDCPRDKPIRVAPTASTRTVFAFEETGDVAPHFIKLHLPRRISRFNRRLRRKNIENSVAITRDMAHVQMDRFSYLPDVLGLTFGEGDNAWGFLVREAVPRPDQGRRRLIPGFALYSGDLHHPGDPPLLVQMIERLGADPQSFVLEEIMIPVVQCWAKIARDWGVLLESHGQNTLLEVDQDFRPRRVVHRDFDVWVDLDVRRRRGLDAPFLGAGIGADTGRSVDRHYSIVYDRFIGHAFFDYLLEALKRFYPIDEAAIRARVSEAFHQAFPDSDQFFPPRTMFYFSNEPGPGQEFTLVDMEQAPEWR